jgi:hypothetical protein
MRACGSKSLRGQVNGGRHRLPVLETQKRTITLPSHFSSVWSSLSWLSLIPMTIKHQNINSKVITEKASRKLSWLFTHPHTFHAFNRDKRVELWLFLPTNLAWTTHTVTSSPKTLVQGQVFQDEFAFYFVICKGLLAHSPQCLSLLRPVRT